MDSYIYTAEPRRRREVGVSVQQIGNCTCRLFEENPHALRITVLVRCKHIMLQINIIPSCFKELLIVKPTEDRCHCEIQL